LIRSFLLIWMVLALLTSGCQGPADDDDSAITEVVFEPSLIYHGDIAVLRVGGTPYEMGVQHGTLLRDELLAGAAWIEQSEMGLLEPLADYFGLLDEAYANSYPDVIDECQGIVDAMDDELWSMDRCLLVSYGDVVLEVMTHELGCSQFVVRPPATVDGSLIHARNLDWSKVDHIIDHPTLIVRFPDEGLANVAFGFPGNVSPYSGMNAAGLALASNEAYGLNYPDRDGHSHTQMTRQLLQQAHSLDEVRAYYEAEDHISTELVVVSDGVTGEAAVFEMSSDGIGERAIGEDGVIFATNHFVHPEMTPLHQPPTDGSTARYQRLDQLLTTAGDDSRHGQLDLDGAITILRDTHNPVTGETHPAELLDDGDSLANNGAIQSMVFLPAAGSIYIADGGVPIPQNSFEGFTLDGLFQVPDAGTADPQTVP
jgi:hypothetical protein